MKLGEGETARNRGRSAGTMSMLGGLLVVAVFVISLVVASAVRIVYSVSMENLLWSLAGGLIMIPLGPVLLAIPRARRAVREKRAVRKGWQKYWGQE